jgi:hypothetical protein
VFRCQERQTQSHILNTDPPAAENLTLKKRNKNRIKVKRSILIEKTERSFRLVEQMLNIISPGTNRLRNTPSMAPLPELCTIRTSLAVPNNYLKNIPHVRAVEGLFDLT